MRKDYLQLTVRSDEVIAALPISAWSVLLLKVLLAENNRRRFRKEEWFEVTDQELKDMCKTRCSGYITKAKKELKKYGVIDYDTENRRLATRYTITLSGVINGVKSGVKKSAGARRDAGKTVLQSNRVIEKEKETNKEKESLGVSAEKAAQVTTELALGQAQTEPMRASQESQPEKQLVKEENLLEDYTDIDTLKAELATISEQEETTLEEPDFSAELDALKAEIEQEVKAECEDATEHFDLTINPDAEECSEEIVWAAPTEGGISDGGNHSAGNGSDGRYTKDARREGALQATPSGTYAACGQGRVSFDGRTRAGDGEDERTDPGTEADGVQQLAGGTTPETSSGSSSAGGGISSASDAPLSKVQSELARRPDETQGDNQRAGTAGDVQDVPRKLYFGSAGLQDTEDNLGWRGDLADLSCGAKPLSKEEVAAEIRAMLFGELYNRRE